MNHRSKTCRVCKHKFTTNMTTQVVCSPECALKQARIKREKDFDRETRQRKQKLKTRSDYLREAQKAFNYYIRLRDQEQGCISCGTKLAGRQYHAGHYRSVGSCPELRFYSLNCFKQCSACNNFLSGNLIKYRKALIKKLGQDKVLWIEGHHPKQRYDRDHLVRIKTIFNRKAKLLLKIRGTH